MKCRRKGKGGKEEEEKGRKRGVEGKEKRSRMDGKEE